jgi:hypothetical protein
VEERRFSAALLVQLGRGFSPCESKHFNRFSDPQPNGKFHGAAVDTRSGQEQSC